MIAWAAGTKAQGKLGNVCALFCRMQGDQRTHSNAVALRAVTSSDGMTADWCGSPLWASHPAGAARKGETTFLTSHPPSCLHRTGAVGPVLLQKQYTYLLHDCLHLARISPLHAGRPGSSAALPTCQQEHSSQGTPCLPSSAHPDSILLGATFKFFRA